MDTNEYDDVFVKDKKINRLALKHALDIRKFEIELYWKRATYFWAFIAATFTGYVAVKEQDLKVLLSCVGVLLSFGWFLANKGSKLWQENWENHVDMLEDKILGPLYKTILHRPPAPCRCVQFREIITGPGSYSVSKINQLISLYISFFWIALLLKALPEFSRCQTTNYEYLVYVGGTILFLLLFVWIGKTSMGIHRPVCESRKTIISDQKNKDNWCCR